MPDKMILNIVATECKPEVEEEFNKWYNEVHIPMLLKYAGIKKVTRYKIQGEVPGQPTYLAMYYFASQEAFAKLNDDADVKAAMDEMYDTWKDGGFEIKYAAPYTPLMHWEQ